MDVPDGKQPSPPQPGGTGLEERLRRSEEGYRVLVDQISEYAIFLLKPDGTIASWNAGAERLKGYRAEEVIGLNFRIFYPEEDRRAGLPDRLLRNAAAQGTVRTEGWRVRKDGTRFWADLTLTALHDPAGGLYGFAKVTRDTTERHRADLQIRDLNARLEERVKERTAELEAANRELDAFAYSVSHDLKAPLRSISGYSEILLKEEAPRLSDDGKQSLSRIQAASQRMGQLIEDLLKLSRVSRSSLRREKLDLAALARSVAAELARSHPGREVAFRSLDCMEEEGDPQLLRIVLENLLGNAWKFTRKTPHAEVEFGCGEKSGVKVYWVRDNGAGFDMRYASKLFTAFQRLHPASQFEGTGIGLATVQRIVRRHGGHVWAEGEEGAGARIFFTLAGG